MTTERKTVIVTGASQGIGAAVANLFLDRGYNVVANSRQISHEERAAALGQRSRWSTATSLWTPPPSRSSTIAVQRFGSVDALVNNAGIFISKPFIDYTPEEFRALSATNLDGFIYITQRVIKQMLCAEERRQRREHHRFHCRSSARGPARVVADDHQGRPQRNHAQPRDGVRQAGIRVNAVAPGVVETPLLERVPKDFLRSLSPLGQIGASKDIADAVLYLTEASQVTGEVLHVNGGSHLGKW